MKLGRLNHIGIATPSIEQSVATYRDVLGASAIGGLRSRYGSTVPVSFLLLAVIPDLIRDLPVLHRTVEEAGPGSSPG